MEKYSSRLRIEGVGEIHGCRRGISWRGEQWQDCEHVDGRAGEVEGNRDGPVHETRVVLIQIRGEERIGEDRILSFQSTGLMHQASPSLCPLSHFLRSLFLTRLAAAVALTVSPAILTARCTVARCTWNIVCVKCWNDVSPIVPCASVRQLFVGSQASCARDVGRAPGIICGICNKRGSVINGDVDKLCYSPKVSAPRPKRATCCRPRSKESYHHQAKYGVARRYHVVYSRLDLGLLWVSVRTRAQTVDSARGW